MLPTSADPGGPTDSVTAVWAIVRAARVLERALGELSLSQFRVLAAVAAGDERASRIARRLALGKPAISATVDSLRQRGLLDRLTIDDDQRAATLSLTLRGATVLAAADKAVQERLSSLTSRTPAPETVLQSLCWLDAAIDAHVAEWTAVGAQ